MEMFRPRSPTPNRAMYASDDWNQSDEETSIDNCFEDCDLSIYMSPTTTRHSRRSLHESHNSFALAKRPRNPTPDRALRVTKRTTGKSAKSLLHHSSMKKAKKSVVFTFEIVIDKSSANSSSGCSSASSSRTVSPVKSKTPGSTSRQFSTLLAV